MPVSRRRLAFSASALRCSDDRKRRRPGSAALRAAAGSGSVARLADRYEWSLQGHRCADTRSDWAAWPTVRRASGGRCSAAPALAWCTPVSRRRLASSATVWRFAMTGKSGGAGVPPSSVASLGRSHDWQISLNSQCLAVTMSIHDHVTVRFQHCSESNGGHLCSPDLIDAKSMHCRIVANQSCAFAQRLCRQHSIKRIAMRGVESACQECMLIGDG